MFQLRIFNCRIFAEGNTYRQNAIAYMFPNEYYYHVQLLEVVGLCVLKKTRCQGLGILPNFDDIDSQKSRGPLRLPQVCSSSVISGTTVVIFFVFA